MTDAAEKAFGGELRPDGARLDPRYHKNEQDIVGVPVTDLRDATSSATEELWQFTAGSFFASGAFWLGFERLATEGWRDPLVWVCGISICFGLVLGVTGYRQSARRVRRLERYCPDEAV
jgi:hypothetical protein